MSSAEGEVKWTGAAVRARFISFFEEKARNSHTFWRSSSVVPLNDPTLLFTNAGMNQFKPLFLGTADPKTPLGKLKGAVNSQKCIRAGGKHNDLDDVGKDTYHHTFFEMLGNWSFGDYFKEEAIAWAWELLTVDFGLPKDRLYATYFEGDEAQGLAPDLEAKELWKRFLPESQIIPGDAKDNFWEMGDTGPCGPCSEVHFDRIGGRDASAIVNQDDPDVIEIWNLVFMQFNRETDGSLRPLPAKHIDTGLGLERIVSILQGKRSNYDTDLFVPLFAAIQEATGCEHEYGGKVGSDDTSGRDMAYRVVADHIRTLVFAITDGASPGASDRDYVVRRVCRRAARFGKTLGGKPGFFASLVGSVVSLMSDAFPEIAESREKVERIIADEEALFAQTLDKGLKKFAKLTREMSAGDEISGADAFLLYQSFGFPVDLTVLMAEEANLRLDKKSFDAEFLRVQGISRASGKGGAESGSEKMHLDGDATAKLVRAGIPVTDDNLKYTADIDAISFNGHSSDGGVDASVLSIAVPHNAIAGCTEFSGDSVVSGGLVGVVLDKTCFYAESGGQIFDTGVLTGESGTVTVQNTQVSAGFVLHIGTLEGTLKTGQKVKAAIDGLRRRPIMANHTLTHVLNFGLRKALVYGREKGDVSAQTKVFVDQRGSLVDSEKLRFDFGFGKKLTAEEIALVEDECNRVIKADLPVNFANVALSDAMAIESLRAVFGEVYPDPVRVVSVGPTIEELVANPKNFTAWKDFSVELCGGTHLGKTSEAKSFALLSEAGIAQGVRRIVGVTGELADKANSDANALKKQLAECETALAKRASGDSLAAVRKQFTEAKEALESAQIPLSQRVTLNAQAESLVKRLISADKSGVSAAQDAAADIIESVVSADVKPKFVVRNLEAAQGDRKAIDQALQLFKKKIVNDAEHQIPVLLCGADKKKVWIFAAVPQSLVAKADFTLTAGDWAKCAAAAVGGKGGGKPDAAQGAGGDVAKIGEAVAAATRFAEEKLA
jgi:alanyl-tRNA synthetase